MTTGEVDKLQMMYIDAGFTTDDTNTTYILKGSQVWLFVNQEPVSSVGHAIADLFPGIPDNLDAAFVWSGNGRIYFVKVQLSVWVNLVKVQWSVWNYFSRYNTECGFSLARYINQNNRFNINYESCSNQFRQGFLYIFFLQNIIFQIRLIRCKTYL